MIDEVIGLTLKALLPFVDGAIERIRMRPRAWVSDVMMISDGYKTLSLAFYTRGSLLNAWRNNELDLFDTV